MKNNQKEIITEVQVENSLEKINQNPGLFEREIMRWESDLPALWGFLNEPNSSLLLDEERAYMHFLAAVIIIIYRENHGEPELEMAELSGAEESAWEHFYENKGGRFRDKLTYFFDRNPQEELLAFVEDSLLDEEEGVLSKEGREPIFVKLYAIIDCLF